MLALLRKDRYWLLTFAVGGLLLHLGAQLTETSVWTRPDNSFTKVALSFGMIAGVLMGLTAALIDDIGRTREYLHHRAVSHARLFWTRQLACLSIVAVWVVVVPALHLGLTWLFRADTILIDPTRYWRLMDDGSLIFVFYGTAYFCATLVRRLLWALPLTFLAESLVFLLAQGGPNDSVRLAQVIPMSPVFLLVTLLLLAGALANERQGREADLPWTPQRLHRAGVISLGFAVASVSLGLYVVQDNVRDSLFDVYPEIARIDGGNPTLVARRPLSRRPVQVDDQHRPQTEVAWDSVATVWSPRRHAFGQKRGPLTFADLDEHGRGFSGRRYGTWPCPYPLHCFATSDGFVTVVREIDDFFKRALGQTNGAPDLPEGRHRLGPDPGQPSRPFPPQAMPVGQWWGGTAYVADPQSGQLWAADLDRAVPSFRAVVLPAGDRFVADITMGVRWRAPGFKAALAYGLIVAGAHGVYVPGEGGTWVEAPTLVKVAAQEAADRALSFDVTPAGALSFAVDVTDAANRPVLHHLYTPRTFVERTLAATLVGGSLLRAPLFVAAGQVVPFGSNRRFGSTWVLDPLVRMSSWSLLAANLLLALGLAAFLHRHLSQSHAPARRRWFWFVAVLVGGVPAFVCGRLIESRRAWRATAAPEATSAAPRLLIESA